MDNTQAKKQRPKSPTQDVILFDFLLSEPNLEEISARIQNCDNFLGTDSVTGLH